MCPMFKIQSNLESCDILYLILEDGKISTDLRVILPTKILNQIKTAQKSLTEDKNQVSTIVELEGKPCKIILIAPKNKDSVIDLGTIIGQSIAKNESKQIAIPTIHIGLQNFIPNLAEGILYGLYKYDNYLTESKKQQFQPKAVNFITNLKEKEVKTRLEENINLAAAINYVKDLVNAPAIDCTPETLAKEAQTIAKNSSKIKVSVLKEKEIRKQKLNLLASVAAGSVHEPYLITLEYKHKAKNKKPLMLVGKGVTFDAGGLNIKPTGNIDTMKFDMAGAATVLGVFKLLSKINLPIHVIGVIPTVENLLGHEAYKPGDIITAYNGKTVEITNTDAEGRLILADALSYGIKKHKPEAIMDFATLTGACIQALGNTMTGIISNNESLYQKVEAASLLSQNKIWRLPLVDYFREKVAGDISDYKNYTGGVGAGASMAAAFLEKFVEDKPWVHFDIAGTAFYDSTIGYTPKGATGQPLKLVYEFLKGY